MIMNPIRIRTAQLSAALIASVLSAASFAQSATPGRTTGGGTAGTTQASLLNFLGNIQNILQVASIAVVTIAVIVAGYQIAFNNKRIAEVSPILIGGVLIGAAGQIASMLVGGTGAY
jgi:type IV secretion system protein VirB2